VSLEARSSRRTEMERARKPTTTRKPPVPSQSHAEIEDWIRRVMPICIPSSRGWTD
jgi:hypothetical protein